MATDAARQLPGQATEALEEYLAALDGALPGLATGVYLTGSAALGDWRPDRSDLDILVVTAQPLNDAHLDALAALHASMPGRPYRDALYLPAARIGARPDDDVRYPHAIDGVFNRARYRPDPVLWATLDRHGLTRRGPDARELGAGPDPAWLRQWNHGNLVSHWHPWAAKVRPMVTGRDPADPIPAAAVAWTALGPGRLHATITTGEIISKTAAAGYTAALLPAYAELLDRARRWRLGDADLVFTAADGLAACDLVDAVVEDAGRAAPGQVAGA